MKKILVLAVLLINILTVSGQNNVADSLVQLLAKAKSLKRVDILVKLTEKLAATDSTQALRYANEALAIAQNKNNPLSISKVYYAKGEMYRSIKKNDKAIENYTKSIGFLNKAKSLVSDTTIYLLHEAQLLTGISSAHYRKDENEIALKYAVQALATWKMVGKQSPEDTSLIVKVCDAYSDAAFLYWNIGKLDESITHYATAAQILISFNKRFPALFHIRKRIASYKNSVGAVHWGLGNYSLALSNFLEALEIWNSLDYPDGKVLVLSNIGLVYMDWDKNEKALTYFLEAQEIAEKYNHIIGLAYSQLNAGKVYQARKDYKMAMLYYRRSLENYMKSNRKNGISGSLKAIGDVYLETKEYQKAITYYSMARDTAQIAARYHSIAIATVGLSNAYLIVKDYDNAEKFANESIELSKKENYKDILKDSYFNLYKIADAKGEYQASLDYYVKYTVIKDSIFSEKSMKHVTQLQTQFETEKKEQENKLLKEQNELQTLMLVQQKKLTLAIIAVAILMIAVATILFYSRWKQAQTNQKLVQQNNEINRQKSAIEQQAIEIKHAYDKLSKLDQFKEGMMTMIVHDLKTPINTIINLVATDNDPQQMQRAKHAGYKMLNLVLNILDVHKFEDAKMNLAPVVVPLNDAVIASFEQVSLLIAEKNISFSNSTTGNICVLAEFDILVRVIVNLLTNAIKFTPLNGLIKIETSVNQSNFDAVEISITDSGSGISPDKLGIIFDKFVQVDKRKIGITNSTGLGLTFCKMAVEASGGKIGVVSTLGEGSRFWFTLPYAQSGRDSRKNDLHRSVIETNMLTEIEKQTLHLVLEQLSKTNIYEISTLRKIIKAVDNDNSEIIKQWKSEILLAVNTGNEQLYNELIKL